MANYEWRILEDPAVNNNLIKCHSFESIINNYQNVDGYGIRVRFEIHLCENDAESNCLIQSNDIITVKIENNSLIHH